MSDETERVPAPLAGRRILIDRFEDVDAVVARLARASVLGVDVEAGIPPRERHSRFALLQIAIPNETYAIDPLRLRDLSPFGVIFGSEHILKVFHGIALDRDMLEGAGLPLRYVVDLSEVARAAYGKGEASLAALSRRAFGIGMDKSLQRSDWLHRPLSLPLLAYAWRDAELTLALYDWARRHHPDLVALHTWLNPRLEIPEDLPPWLRTIVGGSRQSPYESLSQDGLDLDRDTDVVLSAVRAALQVVHSPHMRGRILRAMGDLELYELNDLLLASLSARAAYERATAARALASMGELSAVEAIRALLDDSTEEVRHAAEQALRILPERAAELSAMSEETNPIEVPHT